MYDVVAYTGSYAPPRPLSLKRGIEPKKFLAAFPIVRRADIILLKHRSYLCVKAPLSKRKSLKISSFKGNVQNDESGGRENGSKSIKNPVKLSYVPQDRKETLAESPKVKNNHATPTSNVDETTAGSLAIQYLFKSWLTLLRTPPPPPPPSSQVPNDGPLEEPSLNEKVETDHKIQNSGRGVILKAFSGSLMGLDAAIKIPAMIFIPMYLAVNMKYGPEVAKELTPLWICGPLLVALYIKIVQGLCLLYIYSFKQSVKVVNNFPVYYDFVVSGKLEETINARLWKPVADFRNLGFKGIWKHVQEWIVDKYLDYIESIWPRYCKLLRFLKRANFI
ncbi:hypothetical protein Ccrd_022833 [Cynara cardunculus var. scolymus]|uniref:Embryo defective protein n=1 Tax=Cynara cardunculus var. scolymus TaxID=59895 RepID=A0A103XY29_CYNCS|nr:hypothetical protein Ccrd_022833 [Cynara cardunculus var. scolymus]